MFFGLQDADGGCHADFCFESVSSVFDLVHSVETSNCSIYPWKSLMQKDIHHFYYIILAAVLVKVVCRERLAAYWNRRC